MPYSDWLLHTLMKKISPNYVHDYNCIYDNRLSFSPWKTDEFLLLNIELKIKSRKVQ